MHPHLRAESEDPKGHPARLHIRTGPVPATLHISSPAHGRPWKLFIPAAHTTGSRTQPGEGKAPAAEFPAQQKLAESLAALAPLQGALAACGWLSPEIRWLWTKVDLERRKVTLAPLATARVGSVGERPGRRAGPGCAPRVADPHRSQAARPQPCRGLGRRPTGPPRRCRRRRQARRV